MNITIINNTGSDGYYAYYSDPTTHIPIPDGGSFSFTNQDQLSVFLAGSECMAADCTVAGTFYATIDVGTGWVNILDSEGYDFNGYDINGYDRDGYDWNGLDINGNPRPSSKTLYYNAAVDTAWDTLGNWWQDAAHTIPATSLPADGDPVYIDGILAYEPSVIVTLASIMVGAINTEAFSVTISRMIGDATFLNNSNAYGYIDGNATFCDNSVVVNATVTGDAQFRDDAWNYNGTIRGNASFDNGRNEGRIEGSASFINGAFNNVQGHIVGSASFYDDAHDLGYIEGDAYFFDRAYITGWGGVVLGYATFYDYSNMGSWPSVDGIATFYDHSWAGYGKIGTAVLHDYAVLKGWHTTVWGDAHFYDYSSSNGHVKGDATFHYLTAVDGVVVDVSGWANGSVDGVSKDSLGNTITTWEIRTGDIWTEDRYSGAVITGNAVFYNSTCAANRIEIFGNVEYRDTSFCQMTAIHGNADFYDDTWIQHWSSVSGIATFHDRAKLKYIYEDIPHAVFRDSSINEGLVTGQAEFYDSSCNDGGTIFGDAEFSNHAFSFHGGLVKGNVTVNDYAYLNNTTVDGSVTLNDASRCEYYSVINTDISLYGTALFYGSTVFGDAVFNDASCSSYGTVKGSSTFNDTSYIYGGRLEGKAYFNDLSVLNQTWAMGDAEFNGYSYNYYGNIVEDAVFNDCSYIASGWVGGSAVFNDDAYNAGRVDGNAQFTKYVAVNGIVTDAEKASGVVSGAITDALGNTITTWEFATVSMVYAAYVAGNAILRNVARTTYGTIQGDATFYNAAHNYGGTVKGNAVFRGESYQIHGGRVKGNATFFEGSGNEYQGIVEGNAVLHGNSRNGVQSVIQGNAVFHDTSSNYATATVNGDALFYYGTTDEGMVLGKARHLDINGYDEDGINLVNYNRHDVLFAGLSGIDIIGTANH